MILHLHYKPYIELNEWNTNFLWQGVNGVIELNMIITHYYELTSLIRCANTIMQLQKQLHKLAFKQKQVSHEQLNS